MKYILISFAFFATISIVGCKDGESPIAGYGNVDYRLIGEWYYLDTMVVSYPSPPVAFYGIRIVQGDTVRPLGIETASGRVALIPEAIPKRLLQASNGTIIWEYFAAPGMLVDTIQYTVEPNLLTLIGKYTSTIYHRTQLGFSFVDPVQSVLTVDIENELMQNPGVAPFPSAYVSRPTATGFKLYSRIPTGWISVDLDSFQGVGTYTIAPNKGTYTLWLGDVVVTLRSDSLSPAAIAINQYDEATRRCAGTFEFTAVFQYPSPSPPSLVLRLSNGVFSVPVYR